jgi:Protein of unknown function (DUF998)
MEHISKPMPMADQSDTSSSGLWKGLQSPLTFGLVSCGGVGAFLFTATYLIEGVARPGYDAWQQPISALSLGPGGWVQQVNFVVFGILLVLSAVGWYRFLTPGHHALWFPLFQGLSGLCLIGVGVFSMDPFPGYPPGAALATSTVHGTLHSNLAYALIFTLALGCFTLAAHFARFPRWRGWVVYSGMTGALILVFWVAFVQNATGPTAGLVERLSAGSHALWSCVLVAALFFQKRRQRIST